VSITACFISLIFQQYKNGFKVELRKSRVSDIDQAILSDNTVPVIENKGTSIPVGK